MICVPKCHNGSTEPWSLRKFPYVLMCDVCFFLLLLTKFGSSRLVQALYVNNSINEFMYGGFRCGRRQWFWESVHCIIWWMTDMYTFYPEWKSKTHRKYKIVRLYRHDRQKSSSFCIVLTCLDLLWVARSFLGIYLILIKLMFISKTGEFVYFLLRILILYDEALMLSNLFIYCLKGAVCKI